MSVHGRVPVLGQFFQRADVVEMAVRHHDGGRARVFAEALAGRAGDQAGRAHHARVNQNPVPVARAGRAEKDDVDDGEALIGEVGRDFVGVVVARVISFGVVGAGGGVEWYLVFHGAPLPAGRRDSCCSITVHPARSNVLRQTVSLRGPQPITSGGFIRAAGVERDDRASIH
jgi:hypothetical protein